MNRTIYDSELEHCIKLLLKDKDNPIIIQDLKFKLYQVEQCYSKETWEYWKQRCEVLYAKRQ